MSAQTAVAKVREGLAELRELALWALSDAESRELVADLFGVSGSMHAQYLRALADLDSRPEAVAGARPGRGAVTFVRDRLRGGHAAADVSAAHALESELPLLGEALSAGDVCREHVDVAVRTLRRIPSHLLQEEERRERVDSWFATASRDLPPPSVDRAARHLLAVLDPDGTDRFDAQAIHRREVSLVKDSTGMLLLRGQLDPGTAAPLLAVLDHLARPSKQRDENELPIPDRRSKGQRTADALGVMARLALGALGTGSEVDRPRVVIHAPLNGPVAECEQSGVLPQPWLSRFLCDAVLQAVLIADDGRVLNLGRAQRTVTTHQRRALVARDGGCVIPGCDAPAAWCDAHHVTWWSLGGATDLENLALVCHRHHQDIHAGIWTLQIRDGVPWARPPRWTDPEQPWRRNTYRHHRNRAHQLALDLDLDPPGDPPHDHAA
jgi:hypothetical protein